MRKLKVLVIGGAGFIGSNLCKALAEAGCSVVSLDNYSTGSAENHIEGVEYLVGSAQDIDSFYMGTPDVVFHLGEYSRVEQSYSEPFKAANNIVGGIVPVIEFCYKTRAKLIYSGSSTKFSVENSPYSIAKASNSTLVDQLCSCLGINYAITYFYNVYGQNEISEGDYATVIAKFLKAQKEGKPVIINGTGEQRRNFTHVEDIVNGLILVAASGKGDLYGIGSDESYSIIDVAEMIGVEYSFGPDKAGNRKMAHLETGKTKNLGWSANNSLRNYIKGLTNSKRAA